MTYRIDIPGVGVGTAENGAGLLKKLEIKHRQQGQQQDI